MAVPASHAGSPQAAGTVRRLGRQAHHSSAGSVGGSYGCERFARITTWIVAGGWAHRATGAHRARAARLAALACGRRWRRSAGGLRAARAAGPPVAGGASDGAVLLQR